MWNIENISVAITLALTVAGFFVMAYLTLKKDNKKIVKNSRV